MFLYRFVRRYRRLRLRRGHRRRPQILAHTITFEQHFGFLSFLAQLLSLTYRLPDYFVMILTLIFQGKIWNLQYLSKKWSDCHETKSKHIDLTLGLKCDHQVWPWPWPWPWISKVKYEICYISTKSGHIATKRKANISIWTLGLKCDQWVR